MQRRTFINTGGLAAMVTLTGLAGCTSGSDSPPPRKSNVLEPIQLVDNGSAIKIETVDTEDQWVESRRDIEVDGSTDRVDSTADNHAAASMLSGLSPVGVADAAKGRGATGRGAGGFSSAPKTPKGRARFYGGAYVGGWRDDHDDEIERYPVEVAMIGVAYTGTNEQFEEQDPGAGPVRWDETYPEPNPSQSLQTDVQNVRPGWYRVGAQTIVDRPGGGDSGGVDLGWECVDLRVEQTSTGKEVTERWKVSPRI